MGKLISVNAQRIYSYIQENPKCTRKNISTDLGLLKDNVKNHVNSLLEKHMIKVYNDKRPVEYVVYNYEETENAEAIVAAVQKEESKNFDSKAEIKRKVLENATPRELMLELKKRGFTGTLKLVTINEVNLTNLR